MIRHLKQHLSWKAILVAAVLVPGSQAFAKSGFPNIVFGPAVGYEKGSLGTEDDKSNYQGPAAQLRLLKMFPTFPFTFVGLDARFSNLEIESAESNIEARRTAYSLFAGTMFPVSLFGIKKATIPEGAGPPFYVGYNFSDKVTSDDEQLEDLDGKGWKAGFQLPAGPFSVLQFEYSDTTFEAPDSHGPDAEDLRLKSWTYYFQFLVPITTF